MQLSTIGMRSPLRRLQDHRKGLLALAGFLIVFLIEGKASAWVAPVLAPQDAPGGLPTPSAPAKVEILYRCIILYTGTTGMGPNALKHYVTKECQGTMDTGFYTST